MDEVWLAAADQCSKDARAVFDRLSSGLTTRYPEMVFENDMHKSDIARANLDALRSGKRVPISHIYGSDQVVVGLTFAFSNESPPPHPGFGSKFALSLYRLARLNFDNRVEECSGTGNRRMGILLQYMTRSDFDAKAVETIQDIETDREELVDQL